ncbi:hypothetical protein QLQ85_07355 [Halomonas sp. M4R5S39]|uniref:hypothetical protein n=1 Tax=Halomonas kalidii TaxID=3043293 RepID=UPI0024A88580|nr:hypothetical protein [Halomonas kalidii]MDI5984602.1 hypothetical protein [Halomonas kalidii]
MFACSIFLDARSAGTGLPRHLAALQKLLKGRDGRIELLLVDDTGDPRLPGLASRFGARLLPYKGEPLGDRLNAAVAHSQGTVLVFLAPALPLPADWLDVVAEGREHHRWDVLVLPARPRGPATRLWQWLGRTPPADTLCVAREWFDRIGGFDPSLDAKALPELLERLHACQARVQYR